MPRELARARWVLKQCTRFHCLPSQLYAEDADLLHLLWIEEMGEEDTSHGQ
jgi:hypothetical protein